VQVTLTKASDPNLPKSHPELFHYTTLEGLRGIIQSHSLWATHYSHLNDSTEITFVQQALMAPVAARLLEVLKDAQRRKLTIRRNVRKFGGIRPASNILATEVLSLIHRATFGTINNSPKIAEPYITSFCSHTSDEEYERSHGLLSQWRGYGGAGGFCIVFDTLALINFLSDESRRHFWSYMNIDVVTYSNEQLRLEEYANEIALGCQDCADVLLNDKFEGNFDDLLLPYLDAATHIKHRGFREEREVRIAVSPVSQDQIDRSIEKVRLSFEGMKRISPDASFKEIHTTAELPKRRYLALFEGACQGLPIKRIIVGPSRRQQDNLARAAKMLGGRIQLSCSETPFVGQGLNIT
jgi:hypothetical protein